MDRTIKDLKYTYAANNAAQLMESHLSMYEYDGLPDTLDWRFLERYLLTYGSACIADTPDYGIIAMSCTSGGDLDPYGIGHNIIAITRNGRSYDYTMGVDCVIGYNNMTMTPCGDIWTDAQQLTEVQTSIDFLIFWTRLSPLVRVADDKTRQKVIDAFANIKKGIPVTINSKNLLAEYGLPDDITIDMLTQPDFADKIQYTAKLYDDILRWHYTRYGHAINGNSKAAQQSVEEIDSTTSQAMILPLSMLRAREKMIDDINAMYGLNASVRLSGAWRAEVTAYESATGETDIDNADAADNADAMPGADTGAMTGDNADAMEDDLK